MKIDLAVNAQLNCPCGLFVTEDEEVLFADCSNNRVRKIDQLGMISTIAGTGFTLQIILVIELERLIEMAYFNNYRNRHKRIQWV